MLKFCDKFMNNTMSSKVIVRMAPSPTGNLHIGGIRTALYNYALAKKNNGEFVLRIEDTDQKRFVGGSTEDILFLLNHYGLSPTKYPQTDDIGNMSTKVESSNEWILNEDDTLNFDDSLFKDKYIQTQRVPLYQKYALKLIKNGFAYCCFRSEQELENLRKEAELNKSHKIELGPEFSFEESIEKIKKGEKFVVRLDIEAYAKSRNIDVIKHECGVMGELSFPIGEVSDQVIIKSDGIATYHLAVVVDDYLMNITHPMRASEWIPSTPKQVMIYDALGWNMPQFFHLTAILDPDGGKLSKRKGSVSARGFLEEGYLPEAILNFLMLLGWSSPEERKYGEAEREIYSLEEFVELFDLKDLNKSNPVFNRDKLLWFNQKYISVLNPDDLVRKFSTWYKDFALDKSLQSEITSMDGDFLSKTLVINQERAKTFGELLELIIPFYKPNIIIDLSEIKPMKGLDSKTFDQIVSDFKDELQKYKSIKEMGHEQWESFVRELAEKLEVKAGQAFMTLRLAVLRTPFSPPLFESMEILEKAEVINRLSDYKLK
jgi:glutamyl-tRNA synthetase